MAELAVPILRSQVHAASELHLQLVQWHTTDKALEGLQRAFPDWVLSSSLLKIAAINQLYGTNLYAVTRMATHVENVLGGLAVDAITDDVVDRIAALPKTPGQKTAWTHLSFASKLCHFFVSSERFPIFDSYAVRVLSMHTGERVGRDVGNVYGEFTGPFFRSLDSVGCSPRELDRYLWLRGLHDAWRRNTDAPINGEVRALFSRRQSDSLLRALRGSA